MVDLPLAEARSGNAWEIAQPKECALFVGTKLKVFIGRTTARTAGAQILGLRNPSSRKKNYGAGSKTNLDLNCLLIKKEGAFRELLILLPKMIFKT